jgi:hypothetical protein
LKIRSNCLRKSLVKDFIIMNKNKYIFNIKRIFILRLRFFFKNWLNFIK